MNVRSFLWNSLWNSDTDRLQQVGRAILSVLVCISLGLFLVLAVHTVIDWNRVYHLTIAAGLRDGESYLFAQTLAEVVARYESKIQIHVLETSGTVDNLDRLQSNQVELAMAQADIPAPPAAQLVSQLFPDVYQLVAAGQSGIQTVPDLKGKRVALPPKDGGQYRSFRFLAEHYGLNPDDPDYMPMPDDDAADTAFLKNRVDAVFHVRPPGNQSILKLVQNNRGRLIAIDQAAAMKLKQPTLEATVIPKGTYQGTPPIPADNQPSVAVQRLLLASKRVNKEVIQKITGVLYERRQDLVAATPLAASISPANTFSGTGLPIHPGAQAYYEREKPSFLEQHAQLIELAVTLAVLLGSGFWQLKLQIEQRQKEKADDYIKEIIALMDAKDCIHDVTRLVGSAAKLRADELEPMQAAVIQQVNAALDEQSEAQIAYRRKKISENSLESFKFTLQLLVDTIAWATLRLKTDQSNNSKQIQQALETLFQPEDAATPRSQERNAQRAAFKDAIAKKFATISRTKETMPEPPQSFKANSGERIRQAMDAIFKRAAEALVEERVSAESFQSFRTVWQIATSEIGRGGE